MIRYFKNRWAAGGIFVGLIVVIIIAAVFFKESPAGSADKTFVVTSATVSEVVSATGTVKPADAVDLPIETGGKVVLVAATVGDTVTAGETIVRVNDSDLQAGLKQAYAVLDLDKAKLVKLQSTSQARVLATGEAKLDAATTSVAEASSTLLSLLEGSYATAEDAIHAKADDFIINPLSDAPSLAFVESPTVETGITSGRVQVEQSLDDLQNLLASASTTNVTNLSSSVKTDLAEIKLYLDNAALAVDTLAATSTLAQNQGTAGTAATVAKWQGDLTAARTEVDMALTGILAADNSLSSAESATELAQDELASEEAGSLSQDITDTTTQVVEDQASVDSMYSKIDKTYIKSPIDGIVTAEKAKLGEAVSANIPLVSIISDAQFQIQTYIAQADIAKVAVGEKATVTLDAYGPDVTFGAVVVGVDPTETAVDGIPSYATTLQFDAADNRIRTGMTAKVTIKGQTHSNVLAVPEQAIFSRAGQTYVTVKTGNNFKDVAVTTGLRGSDGLVEITSGLQEGNVVLLKTS